MKTAAPLKTEGQGIPFRLVALGLVVLVLVVAVVIIRNLVQTNREVQQMYAESIRGIKVSGDLMDQIQEARLHSLYTLASTDPNVQLEAADASRARDPKVAALLQEHAALIERTDQPATGRELPECWAAYLKIRNAVLAAVLEGSREEGLQLDRRAGLAAFNRLHEVLAQSENVYARQAVIRLAQIQTVSRRNILTVALMLTLVLVGAGVALRTLRQNARLLHRSRERFELAVAGTSEGIWDWDLVANHVYFSPRWKSMIGYEDAELGDDYAHWEQRLHPEDRAGTLRVLKDYLEGRIPVFEVEFRLRHKDESYVWVLSRGAAVRNEEGQPVRFAGSHTDITARRQAEKEMEALHQQVAESSRLAGMAEVATGVLHNVGNVLNSVSVSATVVSDRLRRSDVGDLHRAAALLHKQNGHLAEFLTTDPRGKLVPEFLAKVSAHLVTERNELAAEMTSVAQNIEHIKEIVSMQQTYAKVFGVLEPVPPAALVADALRMNTAAFERHGVRVVQQLDEGVPPVFVDRHKVLQILTNLLRNAKYALDEKAPADKRIEIQVRRAAPDCVTITVRDNGAGIPPENLTRIFGHGFTTKKDGHGFGLHSGALAAKQMNGRLSVASAGPGLGAVFTLELPVAPTAAEFQSRADVETFSEAHNATTP